MKITFPLFFSALFALSSLQGYSQSKKIITIAGTGIGGYNGDGIAAPTAELHAPNGVAVDANGNVYIEDYTNLRVRKINATGYITTIAGNGIMGNWGNGSISTSAGVCPQGVAVDKGGNVYISDAVYGEVRKINASGIITRIAGTGTPGYDGDTGPATAAKLDGASGMAFDTASNLFVVDARQGVVRMIAKSTGIITTVAGDGALSHSGDGFPATTVGLDSPYAVAADRRGNLYISELNGNRIRKVSADGMLSTWAGTGVKGYSGNGGPATDAQLSRPAGIAVDSIGNLYIADADNDVVRMVDTFGVITTVAGNNTPGFGGDLGDPIGANLHTPFGVALDRWNNLYIADANNQRIRKVYTTTGVTQVNGNMAANAYPNPFTGQVVVTGLSKGDRVCVYDMAGRALTQVWSIEHDGARSFMFDSLTPGVYMLQVSGSEGNKKSVVELVKQ